MSLTEADVVRLNRYQQAISDLHLHLHAVDRFPHAGQQKMIKEFFGAKRKVILIQCARDLGKTEAGLYIAWRYCLTNENKVVAIIAPEIKQGFKIYCETKRLQDYGPKKYVRQYLKSELAVEFITGCKIVVNGCENYDSLRGMKPDLVLYDEVQLHTPQFHEDVMRPNFSRGNVHLVAMGTPPKRYCNYVEFKQDVLDKVDQGSPRYAYVQLTIYDAPNRDLEGLEEIKQDLLRKGKYNVWKREYLGQDAFDTESAVFPMWDKDKFVIPHKEIVEKVKKDSKHIKWWGVYDPGTATCFAVLFIGWNPYTSELFLVDEIYEQRRAHTTACEIWDRSDSIKKEFSRPSRWTNVYDEAAAWFANEIYANYPDEEFTLLPTNKRRRNKVDGEEGRPGESVIMSVMLAEEQKLWVSDRCLKFCFEIENYVVDDNGNYPKKFDHLIDDFFYFILDSGYALIESVDEFEEYQRWKKENVRAETFDDVVNEARSMNDIAHALEAGDDDYDLGGDEEWLL